MWRQTTNEIIIWICIVMFILGTLGNILGLIVFLSRKFRQTTYDRLSIGLLLLHTKIRLWITYKVGQSWLTCKLYRLSSCLRILSAFIIVAWTYERFAYVTIHYRFFTSHQFAKRYKHYFMGFVLFALICILTGPTVYFYQPVLVPLRSQSNTTSFRYFAEEESSFMFFVLFC